MEQLGDPDAPCVRIALLNSQVVVIRLGEVWTAGIVLLKHLQASIHLNANPTASPLGAATKTRQVDSKRADVGAGRACAVARAQWLRGGREVTAAEQTRGCGGSWAGAAERPQVPGVGTRTRARGGREGGRKAKLGLAALRECSGFLSLGVSYTCGRTPALRGES